MEMTPLSIDFRVLPMYVSYIYNKTRTNIHVHLTVHFLHFTYTSCTPLNSQAYIPNTQQTSTQVLPLCKLYFLYANFFVTCSCIYAFCLRIAIRHSMRTPKLYALSALLQFSGKMSR